MNESKQTIPLQQIQDRIFTIRDKQVMFDRDLAELYQIETRVLNQAVKRNIKRFPKEYMFQISVEELKDWKSQIVISNKEVMGIRKMPYVFTEQGIAMLSAILKSDVAIEISIRIINTFIKMRKFIINNAAVFQRLDKVELKQIETDRKVDRIFKALENKDIKPMQGIFYNGQIFDAYKFISDLIRQSRKSIIIIDNYIDDTVLTLLSKRNKNVTATIYTKKISKQLALDVKKYNEQYPVVEIKKFKDAHDRFLIIDEKEVYHFGASLKDLGKKWFAFSKMNVKVLNILNQLKMK
jgi:hypothetical protein